MGAALHLKRAMCFSAVVCCLGACTGKRVRLGEAPLGFDSGVVSMSEPELAATSSPDLTSTTVGDAPSFRGSSNESSTELAATSDGGAPCTSSGIASNEVVWIGDSWFTIPGSQRTRVEELAQAAGKLSAEESYESRAEAASDLAAVVEQYEAARAASPRRVLIMDGGTWDTIVSNGSAASVARVIVEFNDFLTQLGAEGSVEHLIYMLVPELPQVPGVAELRPGLVEACTNSVVPCHFLDLQPLWEGHPEYTSMPDGIQASAQGALVIAEQIWSIMQRECIAQ